ncbi:MAG: 30S ribosomal protein S15 [Bdellovibrionota bacterium]
MTLTVEQKSEIVKKFSRHANDTGSAAVQVALITARVNELQGHFEKHKKDHHSRRGLMKLVGQRRSLLDYVRSRDVQGYRDLIQQLGIRK